MRAARSARQTAIRAKKLIHAADIAAALSTPGDPWSTERARRWLQRSGAGVKRCGRLVTTPGRLRDAFPEAYEALLLSMPEDDSAALG